MYNLSKLISEKGYPDALIDHHHSSSPNYAIYGFEEEFIINHNGISMICLLYTSPSPRDRTRSRMPSSA